MTNNPTIDGVSRATIERIADRLSKAQMFKESTELRAILNSPTIGVCRGCFTEQPTGMPCVTCEKIESERAPAVERQAQAALLRYRELCGHHQDGREIWHNWSDWQNVTVSFAESKLDQTRDLASVQYEAQWLYAKTPEVAALQSTIARLEARIAQLESKSK